MGKPPAYREPCTTASSGQTSIKNYGLAKQCFATFVVSLTALNAGLATGWLNPSSIPLPAGANLVGRFWFNDINYGIREAALPVVLSAILLGLVANHCGRKPAIFLTAIINILGFVLHNTGHKLFCVDADNASWGCTLFSGLVIGPLFLSEISQKSSRGTLITFCFLVFNLGMVIANLPFYFIQNSCNIYVLVPAIQLLLLTYIPESPFFLVSKSKNAEAEESMFWYRGNRLVSQDEVENIHQLSQNFHNQGLLETIKSSAAFKALTISTGMLFFQRITGLTVFLSYSDIIIRDAGNFLGPRDAALVFAGVQLAVSLVGMWYVDCIGRKSLLIKSFGGSFLSLSAMTGYIALIPVFPIVRKLSWVPFACMCVFTASHSAGAPLTSIIPNEVSPVKIKGLMASVNGICTSTFVLVEVGIILLIKQFIGDYSFVHFLIPAVLSGVAIIFTRAIVPETKGKSLTDISHELLADNVDYKRLTTNTINYF